MIPLMKCYIITFIHLSAEAEFREPWSMGQAPWSVAGGRQLGYKLHVTWSVANFLALCKDPAEKSDYFWTNLQLKLIKTGARVIRHARAITSQLAKVAVTGPVVRAVLAATRRRGAHDHNPDPH